MRWALVVLTVLLAAQAVSQDTSYARRVIGFLSSEQCRGRGYVNNGLQIAANFLAGELKGKGALPLFDSSYLQPFRFDVNTFPTPISVKANGKKLRPGLDYLVLPESNSAKGRFTLRVKDSVTYVSDPPGLVVSVQNRLIFSVGREVSPYCVLQVSRETAAKGLQRLKVNVHNSFVRGFESNNVGAYLPGTGGSDSLIVFTAHYDHLGGMGKVYFPGASDNASGSSMVLNLLDYYRTHPPRYTTLFVFFAGEEAGLLGSKFFIDQKSVDLKKIRFLINLDLLGTGDDGIMVVNGAVHEKEFALLQGINGERHLVKEVRKRGKARNSDHYWFSEAGVPAFFIYTLGGNTFYHDVRDKAETLSLVDYMDVVRLLTTFVEKL